MTTTRIDPDKKNSDNIERVVLGMLSDFIGPTNLRDFTNHRQDWVYHQYCIWYDIIRDTHPAGQLGRDEDYE